MEVSGRTEDDCSDREIFIECSDKVLMVRREALLILYPKSNVPAKSCRIFVNYDSSTVKEAILNNYRYMNFYKTCDAKSSSFRHTGVFDSSKKGFVLTVSEYVERCYPGNFDEFCESSSHMTYDIYFDVAFKLHFMPMHDFLTIFLLKNEGNSWFHTCLASGVVEEILYYHPAHKPGIEEFIGHCLSTGVLQSHPYGYKKDFLNNIKRKYAKI